MCGVTQPSSVDNWVQVKLKGTSRARDKATEVRCCFSANLTARSLINSDRLFGGNTCNDMNPYRGLRIRYDDHQYMRNPNPS